MNDMKIAGRLVKYRLGTYASPQVGTLESLNDDGDWMVRNSEDKRLYVLRQTAKTEPNPTRRAHWVFVENKHLKPLAPVTPLEPARYVAPRQSSKYVAPVTPAPKQEKKKESLEVADLVNESLKDLIS